MLTVILAYKNNHDTCFGNHHIAAIILIFYECFSLKAFEYFQFVNVIDNEVAIYVL